MRVEVTCILQYEIPEDAATLAAYDASGMSEVLIKEHTMLEDDSAYLITQISDPGTKVLVLQAVRVPDIHVRKAVS